MKKNRGKIAIALALFIVAVMLMRLAFATIDRAISVLLMVLGALLLISAMVIFAVYFKE